MATLRRTKATKLQKQYTRPAGKGHYDKMVVAASKVVLRNRGRQYRDGGNEFVLFEFVHWCEFAEGFPKGVVVDKTQLTDIRKINAVKLLDWLYKAGHSIYDSGMLVKQTKSYERFEKSIEKLFYD